MIDADLLVLAIPDLVATQLMESGETRQRRPHKRIFKRTVERQLLQSMLF